MILFNYFNSFGSGGAQFKFAPQNPRNFRLVYKFKSFFYSFHESFAGIAFRSETFRLQRHIFLRLRIECWIFDQCIHENPKVLLDLIRANVRSRFFQLLFYMLNQFCHNLIRYVIDVPATFRCRNAVDETDLLKTISGHCHSNFPSIIRIFVFNLQLISIFIFAIFYILFNISLEVAALKKNKNHDFKLNKNFLFSLHLRAIFFHSETLLHHASNLQRPKLDETSNHKYLYPIASF